VFLILLSAAVVTVASASGLHLSVRGASIRFGVLAGASLVPLGVYWWVAQGGPLLLSVLRHFRSVLRK